jgi:hypothetical protein
MAGEMVSKKYLSSIPVHPYDDDATGNGICYKAVKTDRTFASYGVLTTNINVNGGVTSKRTGFIIGDTSPEEISKLSLAISETNTAVVGVMEPVYPLAESGDLENINPDLLSSVDSVDGLTSGSSDIASGIGGFISGIASIFTPPELPPVVVAPPPVITMYEFMSCIDDVCTCNEGYVFEQDGNENTVSGTCNLAPVMYTLTVVKQPVSMGYSIVLTYNMMGGTPFYSPQSFESGTFVSVYAAITNGSSYKQPMFSGCDTVSGLTNCDVTMNGNRTITVSD